MRAALILCLWLLCPGGVLAQGDPLQDAHDRTIEAFRSGDTDATITAAEAAFALARALPDAAPESVLWAYNNLSQALTLAGPEDERARILLEEALSLSEATGNVASQAGLTVRVNLAVLLAGEGALERATQLVEDGMVLARDGPYQAEFAGARAEFYLTNGPYGQAAVALSELLAVNPALVRNSYGDLFVRLSSLIDEAEAAGRWDEALPLIEVKITILETLYPDAPERQDGIKTLYFQRFFANMQMGQTRIALEHLRVWLGMSASFDDTDTAFVESQIAALSQLWDWQGALDEDQIDLLRQLPLLVRVNRSTATAETAGALMVLAEGERSFGRADEADQLITLAGDILGASTGAGRRTARRSEDPGAPSPVQTALALYEQAQILTEGETPAAALPVIDELLRLIEGAAQQTPDTPWLILNAEAERLRVDALFLSGQEASSTKLEGALRRLIAVGHDNAADLASTLGDGAARVLFLSDGTTALPFLQAASAAFQEVETFTPSLLATRQLFSSTTLLTGNRDLIRKELSAVTETLKSPGFRHLLNDSSGVFEQLAWALLDGSGPPDAASVNAGLEALQWTQTNRSAEAVQFLETRLSVDDPARSALLRERQALEERAAQLAEQVTGDNRADENAYLEVRGALSRVDASLNALGVDMLGVSAVRPLSLSEIQSRLEGGEMLVTFALPGLKPGVIPGLEGSSNLVLGITSDAIHIAPVGEASRTALRERVQALRCQVAVNEPGCAPSATRGLRGLFSVSPNVSASPSEDTFDYETAHALYRDLLGGLEPALSDQSHLIIVPPNDLLQLPFHTLVTSDQRPARLADADWLIRQHAVSVLPSIPALRGLRNGPRSEKQFDHMIGFGDPLVGADLPPMDCSAIQTAALRAAPALGAHLASQEDGSVLLADIDKLRRFERLLDTVCELRAIRSTLQGSADLYTGQAATESKVKALDQQGSLEMADILVFATHGVTAGETGAAAPGLVMTPPDQANLADDGLLSAPEIAMMKLNADLVVLSACNTAAGDRADQDGLSGLARAFFQAGARALFVTHWSVFSEASVDVSTGMLAELNKAPEQLYAMALQRSVLKILEDPTRSPLHHHPAYWGAFFIVGAT